MGRPDPFLVPRSDHKVAIRKFTSGTLSFPCIFSVLPSSLESRFGLNIRYVGVGLYILL